MFKPRIAPLGDSAVLIQLGDEIDPVVNRRVHALEQALLARPRDGLIETVPAYASIVVHYEPLLLSYEQVTAWLQEQIAVSEETASGPRRRIEVPVRYGGEGGPDLVTVAELHKLSPRQVAAIHASREYLVYMMGFTPGFPYMGKIDPAIATPRLETPRTHVPAGSVAIAGAQTGIYPVESPGGWRLIGWTSVRIFDLAADPPFAFAPGDTVRFEIEALDA